MHVGQRRGSGVAGFGDQNQVPAEIGFDRAGHLGHFGGNYGILKRLDHGTQPEPTQIAPRGGRAVGGIGLGHLGKNGTAANVGQQFPGQFLIVHQDMRGVVFDRRRRLLELEVIGRLDRPIGHRIGNAGFQCDVGQIVAALIGKGERVLPGQFIAQ